MSAAAEAVAVPRAVEITVYGTPGPQGSKSGFAIKKDGQYTGSVGMKESSGKVKTWRADVREAALAVMEGQAPLDGPLVVSMIFTLRKPLSAPKTRRTWPMKYPDVSKLARSTEDALTSARVWKDDAQVVRYHDLAKVFPGEDVDALDAPGVVIRIEQVM